MEAWARAHSDSAEAAQILARTQKTHRTHVQPQAPAAPAPSVLPALSTYEGSCSAQSPCKWLVARRDGSAGGGELVAAMLLVYSGDTAFGLFTGLDYEGSKECRA